MSMRSVEPDQDQTSREHESGQFGVLKSSKRVDEETSASDGAFGKGSYLLVGLN